MGEISGETDQRGGRSSNAGNAVSKALNVLEAAAGGNGPRRLGDIAADAGVPKASVHRILATLGELGFIASEGDGTYRVGPRMLALAEEVKAVGTTGIGDVLSALAAEVGHTVHMALRSGNHAVYVHKVEADQPYRMASRVGMRLPLHCTAIGKGVLSQLSEEEVKAVVAATGLPARNANTITDAVRLVEELALVRGQGFAIDDEENETTIRCIGAPVFDRGGSVVGGVSISTVTFLVSRDQLVSFAPGLLAAAKEVGALLG